MLTFVYILLYGLYRLQDNRTRWSDVINQEIPVTVWFKMAAPICHQKLTNQHFELDYLICGWTFTHFDIIYDICGYSCVSPQNLKRRWTIPLSLKYMSVKNKSVLQKIKLQTHIISAIKKQHKLQFVLSLHLSVPAFKVVFISWKSIDEEIAVCWILVHSFTHGLENINIFTSAYSPLMQSPWIMKNYQDIYLFKKSTGDFNRHNATTCYVFLYEGTNFWIWIISFSS